MKCEVCNGTGLVPMGEGIRGVKKRCDNCDGSGKVITYENNVCDSCGTPIPTDDMYDFIPRDEVKYCYHCGAKLRDKAIKRIKHVFEFETNEDWMPGSPGCWLQCPFSFIVNSNMKECRNLNGDIKCPIWTEEGSSNE